MVNVGYSFRPIFPLYGPPLFITLHVVWFRSIGRGDQHTGLRGLISQPLVILWYCQTVYVESLSRADVFKMGPHIATNVVLFDEIV